jgi:hypothetical protein
MVGIIKMINPEIILFYFVMVIMGCNHHHHLIAAQGSSSWKRSVEATPFFQFLAHHPTSTASFHRLFGFSVKNSSLF